MDDQNKPVSEAPASAVEETDSTGTTPVPSDDSAQKAEQTEQEKVSEAPSEVEEASEETPAAEEPATEEAKPVEEEEQTAAAEETTEEVAEETPAEEPTEPVNPNAIRGKWYVIHTFAGHENRVATALKQRVEAEHLEDLIFDVLVPTQDKIEIRAGKKETVKEKIFPGYLLVKMILDDSSWLAVRTTQGVTSFVGAGNKPTPVSDAEVNSIVKFTTQGAPATFKDVFMVDDTVKIIDGPFSEFIGKVDSVDKEKGRVRVLVSIFGRETPVELDFLQVQKL